ncbi:MAG: hypothetical protein AAFO69_13020 [Bacteroidota bacterium]
MKNIILITSLLLLLGVSVFAFIQKQEVRKNLEKVSQLQDNLKKATARAEHIKTSAEHYAAQAIDAEAKAVITKELLEKCNNK